MPQGENSETKRQLLVFSEYYYANPKRKNNGTLGASRTPINCTRYL
jgi:hypothetical protein